MSRFKTIAFLVVVTLAVLNACQPAATPFAGEFAPTDPPAATEAPISEPPPLVKTEPPPSLPTELPNSESVPPDTVATSAPPNESSFSTNIVELTYDNWTQEIYDSSLPVLLFFWQPGNSYAGDLIPVVEEIATDYEGLVKVVAINYNEYSEIGPNFEIQQVPTLLFLINGEEQPRLEISATKEEIAQMIDEGMANHPAIDLPPEVIPANIVELTYDNWYDEIYGSSLPVLLFFWQSGNDYSVVLIPAVGEIANEYEGRVKVVAINYNKYPEIGPNFAIEQVPTLLFIIDGIEQWRLESTATK
jgi:thioredoxin 1